MKTILLTLLAAVLLTLLFIDQSLADGPDNSCTCHYQASKSGCVISQGPGIAGYKCRCRLLYGFFITHCWGSAVGCNVGEYCPAHCASKECCQLANGNCNGY